MRVLILDDQPGLAQILAMHMRSEDFSVTAYTCPYEALKNIHGVDILVTDYHMPGMTGLELVRRAYAEGWKGALFIMSGHLSMIAEKMEHPLLCAVLEKPFSTSELLLKLRDLV